MNADVQKAVESLDQSLDGLHPAEAHWSAIKQALRDQEAEIAKYRASLGAIHCMVDRVRHAVIRSECEHCIPELSRITAHLGAEQ